MEEVTKIDNQFLLTLDVEAFLFIHENQNRSLGDVHLLEFRKFLYKKYYKEEDEVSNA